MKSFSKFLEQRYYENLKHIYVRVFLFFLPFSKTLIYLLNLVIKTKIEFWISILSQIIFLDLWFFLTFFHQIFEKKYIEIIFLLVVLLADPLHLDTLYLDANNLNSALFKNKNHRTAIFSNWRCSFTLKILHPLQKYSKMLQKLRKNTPPSLLRLATLYF